MRKFITYILILVVNTQSYAGVSGDLNSFFNGLGYASNATSATAYHGQQAGYYTGGSLYLRNNVRNVQVASVDLPTVSAGCGGINVFMGGFSFINGQGIKDLTKNIMSGAQGYVAELAIQQSIPMAAGAMKDMRKVANNVNRFNINSCHAFSQLVGAVGTKTQESQEGLCEKAAMAQGRVSSWTEAQSYCSEEDNYNSVMNAANNKRYYFLS